MRLWAIGTSFLIELPLAEITGCFLAAGRVYAAYGGVYVAVALLWLWKVDRVPLSWWDITGAAISVAAMGIIVYGGWRA